MVSLTFLAASALHSDPSSKAPVLERRLSSHGVVVMCMGNYYHGRDVIGVRPSQTHPDFCRYLLALRTYVPPSNCTGNPDAADIENRSGAAPTMLQTTSTLQPDRFKLAASVIQRKGG